jgi:hypothetical protein
MGPEMQYVQSSGIEMIGYDAEVQQLHITYKKSGTYVYASVSPSVWEQLLAAPSKGTFVNTFIKPAYQVVSKY